jgi:hypothetical protein
MSDHPHVTPDRAAAVVIQIPRPKPTDRIGVSRMDDPYINPDAWIQGLTEAALAGMRAWCAGAGVYCEPTIYIDPTITASPDA